MAWWDRYPSELDREIQAFETAGMQPRKNEDWFSAGKAVINIRLEVLGSVRDGFVIYPDLYPYFRPTLQVPGLDAGLRHYNPCAGEVCLLKRGTQHWLPNMTAAEHILEMMPHWEQAAVRNYDDPRLEIEDNQAEPVSVYYPALTSQTVVMDSSWRLPMEIMSGRIRIVFPKGYRSIDPSEHYTAWITGIEDDNRKSIEGISLPGPVQSWVEAQNYLECKYPWIRLDAPPLGRTALELAEMLIASNPKVGTHINHEIYANRSGIYGFCFPEEAPGGVQSDGWLFLAYHCNSKAKRKKGAMLQPSWWVIKPDYSGEKDLFERIPELHSLRSKTVVVVGLGCVGAPSALEFARAGVGELRLLDGDSVSAGTTCRWPLGLNAVGAGKVRKLAQYISDNYPFTRLGIGHYPYGNKDDCMLKIGAPCYDYDQWDCLEKLLEGVDLVYDATAEQGINLLLNDLAMARNIPYVSVSSRTGGCGGNVVRVRPGSERGCYLCYLYALKDGQITQPPHDPNGDDLQPVGCGDVTFRAAGFDVEEVALAGVRMAVSTLCEGSSGGYPHIVHDVGILSLRKGGVVTFPEWSTFQLHKHPKCELCSR